MTFLQSSLLYALPLILLPILIHLINQNRYRTVQWAATMFLLQARRMAKGMARLKYFLILLARMLAIAGLIFAVSRPMAGGWLGVAGGGTPELTIIVLDRSASMELQNPVTGTSRRETALEKVAGMFRDLGRNTRTILFDSVSGERFELPSGQSLQELPETAATATSTDFPSVMQSVSEYITANEAGRTDIWICSDLQQSSWQPGSGRWNSVRDQLAKREGLRLYLLLYRDQSPENLAVSVSGVHRRETTQGAELLMDIRLTRNAPTDQPVRVPLTLVINGARSTVDVELRGQSLQLSGYSIPIDRESLQGWGRIELPSDSNPADNSWQFVYAESPVFRTVIVSDDEETARLLKLAAGIPYDKTLKYESDVIPSSQAESIEWNRVALLLWHTTLPTGNLAKQLESFTARGGSVVFFPPEIPDENELFGLRWGQWKEPKEKDQFQISGWRTDSDLLANTQNGTPLPIGQLAVFRSCEIPGTGTELAQLSEGPPLLKKASTDHGSAWFCSTLPRTSHSNLVSNGVPFYIMIQRALALGAASLGNARQWTAAAALPEQDSFLALDPKYEQLLPSTRSLNGGLWKSGDMLVAVNRPLEEDNVEIVSNENLNQVLTGLNFTVIDDQAGNVGALASEVWRMFLIVMIVALMAEAVLCVPQ